MRSYAFINAVRIYVPYISILEVLSLSLGKFEFLKTKMITHLHSRIKGDLNNLSIVDTSSWLKIAIVITETSFTEVNWFRKNRRIYKSVERKGFEHFLLSDISLFKVGLVKS